MRTLIAFLLCCAISSTVDAQVRSFQNFEIVDNDVVFTNVFNHEGSDQKALRQQILYTLRNYPYIRNVQEFDDGVLTADLIDFRVNYKKFGNTYMGTPTEITDGSWTGKVLINFKDGKYRVTIQSLSMVLLKSGSCANSCSRSELLSVDALTSKRDGFRPGILDVLQHLNQGFVDAFERKAIVQNDNW
jgi:Calsequestrin